MVKRKAFASVSMQDDKPFDFLRTLFGTCTIAIEVTYVLNAW